jgi:alcohol dehydrogenase (NADP+)
LLSSPHTHNGGRQNGEFAKGREQYYDLIVSTRDAAEGMPIKAYMSMLWVHGKFVTVGLPDKPLPQFSAFDFIANGCFVGGSHIGSKAEAIEMLKLAADKGIKPWSVKFSILCLRQHL